MSHKQVALHVLICGRYRIASRTLYINLTCEALLTYSLSSLKFDANIFTSTFDDVHTSSRYVFWVNGAIRYYWNINANCKRWEIIYYYTIELICKMFMKSFFVTHLLPQIAGKILEENLKKMFTQYYNDLSGMFKSSIIHWRVTHHERVCSNTSQHAFSFFLMISAFIICQGLNVPVSHLRLLFTSRSLFHYISEFAVGNMIKSYERGGGEVNKNNSIN